MAKKLKSNVINFYDMHPINEDEILAKLSAIGVDLNKLTQDDLKNFDQDHYGGIEAVNILAERACASRDHHVLDACSGMGGPARWLAYTIGCHVTGIDITKTRIESAKRLTKQVNLDQLVKFVHGDVTAMPMPDYTFDTVISQEAWLHIPEKSRLISECVRVLKSDGMIAFTDVSRRSFISPEEESRLLMEMYAPGIVTPNCYLALLKENNCTIVSHEDISSQWKDILVDRLKMYRSLRDTTIDEFGEEHFTTWDSTYSFFVELFVAEKLGGSIIVAKKSA